jgi:hypothetical protein
MDGGVAGVPGAPGASVGAAIVFEVLDVLLLAPPHADNATTLNMPALK